MKEIRCLYVYEHHANFAKGSAQAVQMNLFVVNWQVLEGGTLEDA